MERAYQRTFGFDKWHVDAQIERAEYLLGILTDGGQRARDDIAYWESELSVLQGVISFAQRNDERSRLLCSLFEGDSDYSKAVFAEDLVECARRRVEDIGCKLKRAKRIVGDRTEQCALLQADLEAMKRLSQFRFRSVLHESGIGPDAFYTPARKGEIKGGGGN